MLFKNARDLNVGCNDKHDTYDLNRSLLNKIVCDYTRIFQSVRRCWLGASLTQVYDRTAVSVEPDQAARLCTKPFPKQVLVFTCPQCKSFENTVGKGEIARNEQFLFLPQCFLPFWRTFHHFYKIQIIVWKLFQFGRV